MLPRAWIGATVLAVLLLGTHILFDREYSTLRGKTFDIYQTLLPAPEFKSPVVLVTIDDQSLQQHGRWPWNRGKIAQLLMAIDASGVSAVGLDILFPEPDASAEGTKGDQQLTEALSATNSVLAVSTDALPNSTQISPKAGWSLVGDVPADLPAVGGVIASRTVFNDAASGLGVIRATPDGDGTLRRLPLIWLRSDSEGAQLWPSFALELVRLHLRETGFTARMSGGGFDALKLGSNIIPINADATINLRERYGSLPIISATRLLAGEPAPELGDAIAIVAVSAVGLDQYHATPAQVARLGAEIHGLIIGQILTRDFIEEPETARWIERAWFVTGTAFVIILGVSIGSRPWLSIAAMILVIVSPFVAGISVFALNNSLYEGLQPAAGLLLIAVTSGYANFRIAEQRRKILTRQFSQFLSPTIVRRLADSDAEAMIAVEKREVTALMMDIRGFTAMTHTLAASEIVTVINHFLGIATDEILKRDGTIDKFMGDAVLAIWNAPIEVDDHADRALATAQVIMERIANSNDTLNAQNLPSLRVGAGLETGVCSVGNFGSTRRIDYTAIGDTVNLAARLESATKTVGADLLAGPGFNESTSVSMKSVGSVRLHGFDEEIEAFTTTLPANN